MPARKVMRSVPRGVQRDDPPVVRGGVHGIGVPGVGGHPADLARVQVDPHQIDVGRLDRVADVEGLPAVLGEAAELTDAGQRGVENEPRGVVGVDVHRLRGGGGVEEAGDLLQLVAGNERRPGRGRRIEEQPPEVAILV